MGLGRTAQPRLFVVAPVITVILRNLHESSIEER